MTQLLVTQIENLVRIGAGAFGEVFSARHDVHGQVAVKKIVQLPGESHAAWVARAQGLVAEGQRLKAAEHDRVVRVLDVAFSPTDNAVFLMMDLCDGGSLLADFNAGPMRLSDVRNVLSDVALGLQVIHGRGLLHRDIKPANILRHRGRLKLGDFGLVTDDVVVGYASAQGYIDHLAPEVFSTGLTSKKTDIWALGMTAYRLLHGEKFYSELPDPRAIVPHGGFAAQLPWLPHIPKRWRSFVRKMMNDDSAARYQTADQVLTAVATLPVAPDWTCEYDGASATWTRTKGTRVIAVRWDSVSARKHEWLAVSSPRDGIGRDRQVAACSTAACGRVRSFKDLEDFLLVTP